MRPSREDSKKPCADWMRMTKQRVGAELWQVQVAEEEEPDAAQADAATSERPRTISSVIITNGTHRTAATVAAK